MNANLPLNRKIEGETSLLFSTISPLRSRNNLNEVSARSEVNDMFYMGFMDVSSYTPVDAIKRSRRKTRRLKTKSFTILLNDSEQTMSMDNGNNAPESAPAGQQRWTRVRKAYQAGELDRENVLFRPQVKRQRRNALANISAVSTNAQATSQKHRFHQLVERVRELQNEIVPDLHLYQMNPSYPSFSPNSNVSATSLAGAFPHRQSLSASSNSTNSSQSNQRLGLSPRILERAHQIPER